MVDLVVIIGSGTVGLVIGVVIALYIHYRPVSFPVPKKGKKEGWKHLKRLCKRRANIKSKRNALKDSYKAGKVDESTYVSKDAKYEHKLDALDGEIDEVVKELSKEFLPKRMDEEAKKFQEMKDLVELRRKAEKLSKENEELESKVDSLTVKLDEAEDMERKASERARELEKKAENEREKTKKMRERIESKKEEIKELKKKLAEESESARIDNLMKENKLLRERLERIKKRQENTSKELKILELLRERHRDYLKDQESKTASELKALVKPDSETVQDLAKAYDTSEEAYEFVRDNVDEIKTSFEIWLEPEDVNEIRAADNEDRAILLCSILRALGKEASVLVLELMNGRERSLVELRKDSRTVLLDLDEGKEFDDYVGDRKELLKEYSYEKSPVKEIIYEFNDKKYKTPSL